MPFIPVPGTALIEVVVSLDGQTCENTLYFNKAGAWTAEDLTALGNAVITWWADNMAPLISSAVTFVLVRATDLTTDTSASVVVPPAVALAGGNSGAPGPNNSAFVLKFNTAGRGRSSRGRNYVLGFSELDVTISHISSVLADQFKAAYTDLFSVATEQGVVWSVVSRFLDNAPRAEGISIPILSVNYTDLVVDSQRRRLPGRGT
jgi:hypothetical protein